MTVYRLPQDPTLFPDPCEADPDGLLAIGGDLTPERLVAAYASGIFPWFSEGEPLQWWSPDPRAVLWPREFHVSRSLERTLRRGAREVTVDTAFGEVMERCARTRRPGQRGTWITRSMRAAYEELHARGLAHSVETREDGRLVGGLYGVSLGSAFFGESMFAAQADASKVALAGLCRIMAAREGGLVDCQMPTAHLLSLGARVMPRRQFLRTLRACLARPTARGVWQPLPEPQPGQAGD